MSTPLLPDKNNNQAGRDNRHVIEQPGDNLQLGLVLQLSVFAVVGTLLMLLVPEAPWAPKLLIIALVFLTLKRWGGILVLILVQADLFLREGQQFARLNGPGGVLFVFVVVTVLMFVSRHRLLLQQIAKGSIFSLARQIMANPAMPNPDNKSPAEKTTDSSSETTRMLSAGLRGATLIFGVVLVSRLLLGMLPANNELTGNLRELTSQDPELKLATAILISMISGWIVISEIAWRQMSASQSRVYLRSSFLKIHYRDLRMIVMRRLKLRRKRLAAAHSKKV